VSATVEPGRVAPEFVLPDADGKLVRLSDFRGKSLVLYFYPRSFSGGCTTQSCGLRDAYSTFEAEGIAIVGVSVDNRDTQRRFRDEYSLPFPVLADEDGAVSRSYGVLGESASADVRVMQARRVTFIIDANGLVRAVIDPAHADAHVDEVRQVLSA
jgi:thioredoxin-dependent peroxiredoxin